MTDDVNDIAKLVSSFYFKLFFMLNNSQQLMALTFLSKVSKSVLKPGEYEKKDK